MITTYGWERVTRHERSDIFQNIDFSHRMVYTSKASLGGLLKSDKKLSDLCTKQLEKVIKKHKEDEIAAFIFEPIQGEGGMIPPDDGFWPLAYEICKQHNILMIDDESLTFAKTGSWFALRRWGIELDMVIMNKSVNGGYGPLAGVIMSKDIKYHTFEKSAKEDFWRHVHTYGGHPVMCADSLKNIEIMERENLVRQAEIKGSKWLQMLRNQLIDLPTVKEVRGCGLLMAVELVGFFAMDIYIAAMQDYHIIVYPSQNGMCINMTPAPIMADDQFEKVSRGLKQVLMDYNVSNRIRSNLHSAKEIVQEAASIASDRISSIVSKVVGGSSEYRHTIVTEGLINNR